MTTTQPVDAIVAPTVYLQALSKLRHLYENMINGKVQDTASAKRIATGLLGPAIERLEHCQTDFALLTHMDGLKKDAAEAVAKERAALIEEFEAMGKQSAMQAREGGTAYDDGQSTGCYDCAEFVRARTAAMAEGADRG